LADRHTSGQVGFPLHEPATGTSEVDWLGNRGLGRRSSGIAVRLGSLPIEVELAVPHECADRAVRPRLPLRCQPDRIRGRSDDVGRQSSQGPSRSTPSALAVTLSKMPASIVLLVLGPGFPAARRPSGVKEVARDREEASSSAAVLVSRRLACGAGTCSGTEITSAAPGGRWSRQMSFRDDRDSRGMQRGDS
jgi:hypothetical protein